MNHHNHTQHLPHQCTAILDIEPRTAEGKGGNPWWLIARCDDEIVEYYRWWVNRMHHIKLQRPLFGRISRSCVVKSPKFTTTYGVDIKTAR